MIRYSRVDLILRVIKEIDLKGVLDSKGAIKVFSKEIGELDREAFAVLSLDTKGNLNRFQIVHIGSLNESIVHPREVFKLAVLSSANKIIIGHNHPSGDLTPSEKDIDTTKQMIEAGRILGIEVLDHIIVSGREGKSMREKNNDWFISKQV